MTPRDVLTNLSADRWLPDSCVRVLNLSLHATIQAATSLLNFHWFPPECPCECGSQTPSIREDVKYRARWTRIERGRERGGESRKTPKESKGQMREWLEVQQTVRQMEKK